MEIRNPIIGADMPDPDLLRIGDTYYMVSTTMFYVPGAPVLKSKDLCHWEIVSYIFDMLEDNEIYRLENGRNAYGKGQWATSLTRYQDRFYACFVSHDCGKTYIFSSDDIEKSGWDRVEINEVFQDMSFLFGEDVPYQVYGNGDIRIVELKRDLSGVQEGGLHRLLLQTASEGMMLRCEGCRAIVRNGYIYLLFIDWPKGGRRREVCYRSQSLEGPWEFRVLLDDDCGLPGCGVAQGTLIDSESGESYGMLFQDRGASGRIPYLMPVQWEEGWPMFGVKEEGTQEDGEGQPVWKVPRTFELPFAAVPAAPVAVSDSFSHEENRLGLTWQWNHNPIPSCWSFTERPGWLRLQTGHVASGLMDARNTLTQRTAEPGCICEIEMDASGMKEGDYAGLCAFQGRFGQIGVSMKNGRKYLSAVQKDDQGKLWETETELHADTVSLRVLFDYRDGKDQASFFYKEKEAEWVQLGNILQMAFTLDVFVGYRIGIFCYARKEAGGYADFRDFKIHMMADGGSCEE